MNLDVHTLIIVIGFTNFMQVIALFIQFLLDRSHNGPGWWTLGSAFWASGAAFNYLRDVPALGPFAIAANNILFVSGMGLLYVGVLRFLGLRERRGWLIGLCSFISLVAIYFSYFNDNLAARRVNISIALAVLSFLIARALFAHRSRAATASSHFLAAVFLINGIFFAVRAITPFSTLPVGSLFSDSLEQTSTYLETLAISTLWTFGFIILINQRLNAQNREARDNQELIFNTSPDASMITRLTDGNLVGVNDGFTVQTGFTRAEVVGKTTLEVNIWKHPADRDKFVRVLNEKGFCENMETVLQRKDGSLFTGMISARVISLQGIPHIISVTRDITERQQVENKFRMLFELSPLGLAMVDNDTGEFLEVNDAVLKATGYTRDEFLKLSFWDITPREYEAQEQQQLQDLKETGHFGPNEKEYIRKDGTRFPISISGALFTLGNGKQVVWGNIEDISQRKLAEKEKQKVDERLRTLSVAIEQTPVTTVITDLTGAIVFANPKFAETTGYSVEEAIGQNPRILKSEGMPGPDYKELWETILSGCSWHGVFHNRKKNGELYWESAVISPVKDENGRITHFLAVKEDITERRRMEELLQLQATTDELTHLTNRRRFLELAYNEIKRANRLNHSLSIAMIDIDYFKSINDTYGHAAGDEALGIFAKICQEYIREIDILARFGGDEFAMLLPETGSHQAFTVVERIRQALASHPVMFADRPILITISSGISGLEAKDETLDMLLGRADQALYQAKEMGRNCVVVEKSSVVH